MSLLQLQFGRVLDGDNAFALRDEAGKHIQQSGFARTRTPRDYDVQPGPHGLVHDLKHLRGIGAFGEQVLGGEGRGAEAAYGENGAIDGQRRHDHVDARAIWEPRIANRG